MIGEIRYEWLGHKFTIPVKAKYTIIQGDSGEGKSFSIFAYKNTKGVPGVIVAEALSIVTACNSKDCSIIMMDEEDFMRVKHTYAGLMNESDKQFIIISRSVPGNVPVDYRDVYVLRKTGKYYFCDRKYKDYDTFIKSGNYLCEDKKSGFIYLSNHFNNVRSAEGCGNIPSKLQHGDTVFADGAAIGATIDKILTIMHRDSSIHLYLPTSFEYLVCKYIDKRAGDSIEWWKNYASSERYYTDLCKRLCKNLYIDYKKEHLHRDILKMRLIPIESNPLEERIRSLGIDGAESIIPYLPEAASGFSDDELKELVKSLLD